MAQSLAKNLNELQLMGVDILAGDGAPTGVSAKQGSLYLNRTASTTTTRLYINTDGGTTWATFTASA